MRIEIPFSGARITVRDYGRADLSSITAMWFDEVNGQYMVDPTEAFVDDWYRNALNELEDNPEGYYLTIVLNGTDRIIGSCCMFPDEKGERYDIGYCIHKNYWRQGLGTELIALIIGWVRSHGGTEITAEVAKENVASNRLLLHYGFRVLREATFRKHNMDVTFESYIYGLTLGDGTPAC